MEVLLIMLTIICMVLLMRIEYLQEVQVKLKNTLDEKEEIIECLSDMLETADNRQLITSKAFAVANNAIYFNDCSDYLSALYEVCNELNSDSEYEPGKEYIEED